MTPNLTDLFGEIPVHQDEIELWLDVVPGLPRTSWRRQNYAAAWNVAEKVRQAKAAGDWPEIEKAREEQFRAFFGDMRPTSSTSP